MAAFAMELQGPSGALLDEAGTFEDAFWQETYLGSPAIR